jgi:type IV secretion system protein VirB10
VSSQDTAADPVLGERSATIVNRAASLQSKLSNLLAIGLMSVLGLGALAWYYAHNMARQSQARLSVQKAAAVRAEGDTTLPSLGRIDPPIPMPPPLEDGGQIAAAPLPLATGSLTEAPLAATAQAGPSSSPPPLTPEELAAQRRLSGAVFSNGAAAQRVPPLQEAAAFGAPATPAAAGELSGLLRATVATAVRAEMLPAQRLLLPKGAFIDCTLETAIDSTLPGMTTCVMATDTFGVDGKVVLLERGTKLIGETRGQVQQGQARIFVLWTEARTPTGVVVPLASPGADELGRAGLPGEVNRHFWERFGAAMLISIIDGAVEAGTSRNGNGTVIVDPSATQGVTTEVLKGTVNIPPTILKKNGDRIQVLVARDLDFRSVYELRSAAAR